MFLFQRHAVKSNAIILQRPHIFAGKPDHAVQGVIGHTADAQHFVPRAQHTKQRHRQGVGTAGKIVAHQRVLRAEHLRPYFVQGLPTLVAVTVAGAAAKVPLTDAIVHKGPQHLQLIVFRYLVNLRKSWRHLLQRSGRRGLDSRVQLKKGGH